MKITIRYKEYPDSASKTIASRLIAGLHSIISCFVAFLLFICFGSGISVLFNASGKHNDESLLFFLISSPVALLLVYLIAVLWGGEAPLWKSKSQLLRLSVTFWFWGLFSYMFLTLSIVIANLFHRIVWLGIVLLFIALGLLILAIILWKTIKKKWKQQTKVNNLTFELLKNSLDTK